MAILKVGPCGGEGGDPNDMLENNHKITRIDKIRVYYSKYIHAITIYFTVGGREFSVTWGVPGGNSAEKKNEVENKTCYPILPGPFEQFKLQVGEYITSVKGYYGGSSVDGWCGLRQLMFGTSGNKHHGPYGPEVGTEFDLPAITLGPIPNVPSGEIIAFHGRSDGIGLNALGVYIKVELPE